MTYDSIKDTMLHKYHVAASIGKVARMPTPERKGVTPCKKNPTSSHTSN